MATVEDLQKRVKELEDELAKAKQLSGAPGGAKREKITEMSSEVVDSNPYR